MQRFHPHRPYVSSSASDTYLVIDLGASTAVRLLFLGYTNLTSAATYRLRAASSEANLTSAPSEDTGVLAFDAQGDSAPHLLHLLPSAWTYRYWRVDIANAGGFSAGRLYLANPWQARVNMDYGAAWGINDRSVIKRSSGGVPYVNAKTITRTFTCTLAHQSEAEARGFLYRLYLARGEHRDVLVCSNPASAYLRDETIYGLLEANTIINTDFGQFENKLTIEEIPAS